MFYAWITDLEACMTSFINGLHVAGKLHQAKAPQKMQVAGTMITLFGSTYRDFFKHVYIPVAKFAGLTDW